MSIAELDYDVAIMGGGLAGLTLALQLQQRRPTVSILVVEKRLGPAPEGAFKVGESAVELASWYLAHTLGLEQHLEQQQLPKFGLRYFLTAGDNRDVARRCEFGPLRVHAGDEDRPLHRLPVPAYNLDRGRLENFLLARCRERTIDVRTGARVTGVELVNGPVKRQAKDPASERHTLEFTDADGTHRARAPWLVDASGRASILKRKLGLAQSTEHKVDAVWFRLDVAIDPEDWSAEPAWRARTRRGLRRLSTNHLMGPGYWVWLIPLASGATSVGIVIDAAMHDISAINRFERALAWLHEREPQCARTIDDARASRQDFQVMRGGAYGCQRLFSAERWAITGDAGVFLDPLYSPGSDFIAVGNTLITDLIDKDFAGEKLRGSVRFAETLYQGMFQQYLLLYRGQYEVMGHPQVMVAKIVWDTALYFGYNLLLFRNERLCDRKFFVAARESIKATLRMQGTVQAAFKRWARRDQSVGDGQFVDQATIGFLWELYTGSKRSYDDDALLARLRRNIAILEEYARQIVRRANDDPDAVSATGAWTPGPAPSVRIPGQVPGQVRGLAPEHKVNLSADLQRLSIA